MKFEDVKVGVKFTHKDIPGVYEVLLKGELGEVVVQTPTRGITMWNRRYTETWGKCNLFLPKLKKYLIITYPYPDSPYHSMVKDSKAEAVAYVEYVLGFNQRPSEIIEVVYDDPR